MAETMVIDVHDVKEAKVKSLDHTKELEMNTSDNSKKSLKRKRAFAEWPSAAEREARAETLRKELCGLFSYFREVSDPSSLAATVNEGECGGSRSLNSAVACLIEESDKPLSKLVNMVYENVRNKGGADVGITAAAVKSSVLLIGQRSSYGVPNVDADVLEDETESCLWCWEARDLKLMPKYLHGVLKIRRFCRRKIHERISAVCAMITALQEAESHQNYKQNLVKVSEKLCKSLSEEDIRLLMQSMVQRNGAEISEKKAKQEEKFLLKQLEKNRKEAEKEKKRLDRELQKEKLQNEKEFKRLQDEALKDERRREREESEMKKQIKRQQEEAEKDQQRREKEEAEKKKQLAMKKQASIMERFLKRTKTNSTCLNNQSSTKAVNADSLVNKREELLESVSQSMDHALSLQNEISTEDIWKSHLTSWHCLGHSFRSNRKQHWGLRRTPKTELIKELKLITIQGQACDHELGAEKLVDGWEVNVVDEKSSNTSADSSPYGMRKCTRSKQLLQFDKSHRPAFYGIWHRRSQVVGPRHPFKKDSDLDYEIDSDEEWAEEDPGESLSDCDKDEGEELEEGYAKVDDEDESEDGFFVPDGYLSENEGVQVDRMDSDELVDDARSSPSFRQESESDEFSILLRHQKYLHSLTEHALRKNQPLIILNLMHEKASLLSAEDLNGTPKLEQMCLQALSMHALTGGSPIEMPMDGNLRNGDQEACSLNNGGKTTQVASATTIPDSDLPKLVFAIQSFSQGICKLVESLQQMFPTMPKSLLRNKVREISTFADNRWQVKKDILDKLGLSNSPEKSCKGMKSIATFFSKRCLPPTGRCINSNGTSPESVKKPSPVIPQQQQQQQSCTDNHI